MSRCVDVALGLLLLIVVAGYGWLAYSSHQIRINYDEATAEWRSKP